MLMAMYIELLTHMGGTGVVTMVSVYIRVVRLSPGPISGHPSVDSGLSSVTGGSLTYAPTLTHIGKANPKTPPTKAPFNKKS